MADGGASSGDENYPSSSKVVQNGSKYNILSCENNLRLPDIGVDINDTCNVNLNSVDNNFLPDDVHDDCHYDYHATVPDEFSKNGNPVHACDTKRHQKKFEMFTQNRALQESNDCFDGPEKMCDENLAVAFDRCGKQYNDDHSSNIGSSPIYQCIRTISFQSTAPSSNSQAKVRGNMNSSFRVANSSSVDPNNMCDHDDSEDEDIHSIGNCSTYQEPMSRSVLPKDDGKKESNLLIPTAEELKRKDKAEENPFSFKKFIMGSSHATPSTSIHNVTDSSRVADLDLAHDLPDFVQTSPRFRPEVPLPDFVSGESVRVPITNQVPSSPTEPDGAPVVLPVGARSTGGTNGHLPDFLPPQESGHDENSAGLVTWREIEMLRAENAMQKQQLQELKVLLHRETDRATHAVEARNQLLQKEKKEVEVMEDVVQQVESNLMLTMERAQMAEGQALALESKVAELEEELQEMRREALLRENPMCAYQIQEKAKYASQQISNAAENAEQTLKQLLNGVETLKLVSEVLASVDKITEDGASNGHSEHTSGGSASAAT